MHLGVNVPNYGSGASPAGLRGWAEWLATEGFDALMLSDHVVVTADVAAQYPAPFYDPFTTLAWLAGATDRIRLGTTVLVLPYRNPLVVARMAANLNDLSGGRFILGVGVGWARQEYSALGVSFTDRGRLTDAHLNTVRSAWSDEKDYPGGGMPIWIGGNSDAAIRRAVRFGAAWHPIGIVPAWLDLAVGRMKTLAEQKEGSIPALNPRITLRLTERPVIETGRRAGVGTLDQILGDLGHLQRLGAESVVLDPFIGAPEAPRPAELIRAELARVAAAWSHESADQQAQSHADKDDQ